LLYDLLFKAASETMLTIAAAPRHLGARIRNTAVLHSWGSAMIHHPHVHMIVPGGGLAKNGVRCISSRPAFLLPVRVLSKLFRRLFLNRLIALHEAGRLNFFGSMAREVYAKPPFAGPEADWPIFRATLTASPSRTAGSSASTMQASPSVTRTIVATGPNGSRS